jgi:type IV secretion system protein TrbL
VAAGARGGASVAGGAVSAYRTGAAGKGAVAGVAAGAAGVAKEGALAAISPLRRAAASLKERFDAGAGAGPAPGSSSAPNSGEPAWASRMRRRQTAERGASAASHALRSGDHPSSGSSVDLSEE